MSDRPKKTPKRIEKVVCRCRQTGYILKTMPVFAFGDKAARWQYADGIEAPAISTEQAIRRGLLIPRNDGLFGAETSQTWVAP